MTVSAPAERPRILAELAERPGRTAYEVADALGYGKPDSRRIAEIVRQLWHSRCPRCRERVPSGTGPRGPDLLPRPARYTAAAHRRNPRAGRAAPGPQPGEQGPFAGPAAGSRSRRAPHLTVPAAASIGRDSERAACRDADPDLFFGPGSEWPKARAARVAKARAYCFACPIRLACLEVARANRETYGVWGGIDFETERDQRSTQATRPDVAASSRA